MACICHHLSGAEAGAHPGNRVVPDHIFFFVVVPWFIETDKPDIDMLSTEDLVERMLPRSRTYFTKNILLDVCCLPKLCVADAKKQGMHIGDHALPQWGCQILSYGRITSMTQAQI
jgi:hypothetical protein